MAESATRELLGDRPYLALLIGRTLAMLAFAFGPVALAFGILALPWGTDATLSVVLFCQITPQVILTLFGGVVADRYPRALVLQLGVLVMGIGWAAIGIMMLTGLIWIWLICIAAAVTGIAGAVVYPALTGIIPEIVPAQYLQKGNAWIQLGAAIARLMGMVSAGAVVVFLGGGWAVFCTGAVYLAAAVTACWLPRVDPAASPGESPLRQLREGWGEFRSRQWLWAVILQYAFVIMVFSAAHGVLGPVLAEKELGGAVAWTAILAGEAFGAGIGVLIAMKWMPKHPILIGVLATAYTGVPMTLLGLGVPVPIVVVAAIPMGFAFEFFTVVWLTTMQLEVPPESLSRVASYDAFGSLVLGPVGLVFAAPLAGLVGIHAAMIACGALVIGVSLGTACFPEVRSLQSRAAQLAR
jgi:MFS family permease